VIFILKINRKPLEGAVVLQSTLGAERK